MISFFAKPSFLANQRFPNSENRTIVRLSSEIRGKQIADYLGEKYNPKEGFENDLCVYIKPMKLDRIRDTDIVDFSDGMYTGLLEMLKTRPKIRVLAHSTYIYKFLKDALENEIIYLPQQHLNWERQTRTITELRKGGCIGSHSRESIKMGDDIRKAIAPLEFEMCVNWQCREDAVDFYKRIDFLVIYGSPRDDDRLLVAQPTKMINAASFGIPSFATWQAGFEEFEGYYTQFTTLDDLVEKLNNHKIDQQRLINKAEEYHISKIAERYKQLCVR
jgi:hypothetical protein